MVSIVIRRDSGVSHLNVLKEKEPNNAPAQGQTIPVGQAVQGFINKPFLKGRQADRDCFLFEVPETQTQWNLRARLTGVPGLRLVLEVREGKTHGTLTKVTSRKKGKGLALTNLTLKPGRYYFRIHDRWVGKTRRHNLKRPYILTWEVSEQRSGEEREPNDNSYAATELAVGGEVSGFIGRRKDVDWYKVSLAGHAPGVRLRVVLDGVPGVRARVGLYGPKRNRLARRAGRRSGRITVHNLQFPPLYGFFFVVVDSAKGFNASDRYILRVETAVSAGEAEAEPNDTFGSAMELAGSMGKVQAVLDDRNDVDMFKFRVTKPQTLRVEAAPDSGLDLKLMLFGPMRKTKARGDAGRRGFKEVLPNVRLAVGLSWLKVTAGKRSLVRGAKYELMWRLYPIERGDEAEPNDAMGKATSMLPGVSARGYIYPPGDVDYYRFRLKGNPGTVAKVTLSVQGIPKVRLKLQLLDGVRNVLGEVTRRSSEGLRRIQTNLHVGKPYYLRVKDAANRRSNATDSYELHLVRHW